MQTLTSVSSNIKKLYELASSCKLCPRECKIDRLSGQIGFCGAGSNIRISSTGPHNGEEPPISGSKGSGTIFFAYCTMRCMFCQNYPISHLHNGYDISVEQLAEVMLEQQTRGCHNVNLVTPSHYSPWIAHAVEIARASGLKIPIVYNCSGYESVEVLRLMEGVVDIYLPDSKYDSDVTALEISRVSNYVESNRAALLEMSRQVGALELDEDGIAVKGLIIRHLVLPQGKAGTKNVLRWISQNIPDATISLMSQYFPAHLALDDSSMNRNITEEEYDEALEALEQEGLGNGWIQPFDI